MQLVAYPSVFMMGISAMKRQGTGNSWEWFKYLHFVFLALIPATLLHAASSPYFLLGGIAFWLFDATLRYAGVADLNTKLLTMEVSNADGGVTKLTFSKTHSEPGQFAWIKVPAISEWEWHPFSLSSSPNDGHSEICVKSMGPNTFTDKLFQLTKASQQDKSKPFKIMVDGPHGIGFGPLLAGHASVLLIAGGIGITPMHSTFRTLAQMLQRRPSDSTIQTVKLVWTARSAEMFEVFGDSLDFCLSCSDIMSLALYATGKEKAPSTKGLGFRLSAPVRRHLQLGRPNFDEIMDQTCTSFVLTADRELEQGTCLVLACGPESMVAAAASATKSHQNIDFHNMLFRL
jgi:NAD(P)H-flavin reductase